MSRPLTRPAPLAPLLLLLTLVVLALAPGAARATDVAGPQLIAFLNAQRAANGIPAGIAEDPALSDGCVKHNRYGAANGTLVHHEDPSSPAYTPTGDIAAGTSVLYRGTSWTAQRNPFELAPIHLHQLLSPFLDRAGADETAGYGCLTTLASVVRPTATVDTLYTYPGDGTRDWRASEVDREGPFTPGETVGIPAGTRTGPTLYVMASGPGLHWASLSQVVAASLTGPDGPVALVTFDRSSPQVGPYLPVGAQLLPRSPLRQGATYTAAITLRVTGDDDTPRDVSRTWSFTTAVTPPPSQKASGLSTCATAVRFVDVRRVAGVRRLRLRATACHRAVLQLVVRRAGRVVLRRSLPLAKAGTRIVSVATPHRLPAGRYAVRATLAGATLSFSARLPVTR